VDVEKIYLVWNADKGLIADLRYTLKKLGGNTECSLCDLTHGWLTETPAWKACKLEFAIPFEGLYRDHLSEEQALVVGGDFPAVLAETTDGLVKLIGSAEIEACDGDPNRLAAKLHEAIGDKASVGANR
jgi:hypothetical protein